LYLVVRKRLDDGYVISKAAMLQHRLYSYTEISGSRITWDGTWAEWFFNNIEEVSGNA